MPALHHATWVVESPFSCTPLCPVPIGQPLTVYYRTNSLRGRWISKWWNLTVIRAISCMPGTVRKGVIYLKCDSVGCQGTAKIDKEVLVVTKTPSNTTRRWREKSRSYQHGRECGNVRLMTAAQVYAISTRGDKTVAASYATVENSLYKRRRLHQSTLSSSTDEVAGTIENSRCARPRNVL